MQYKDRVLNVFKPNKDIPIYSVDSQDKVISITFDCAWGGEDIPKLIEILKRYNIKATFFVVGDWADKYPENIKLLHNNGHDVANHSDKHLDMTALSESQIKEDMEKASSKITVLTGVRNNLFRAPYGSYNNRLIQTAKSLGYYTIQWDVDSLDWKDLGVSAIVERVTSKVKNGSIVLFHNDTKYTLEALPEVIENLKVKGYNFVKLSDMIIKDNYYIDVQGTQKNIIRESWSID